MQELSHLAYLDLKYVCSGQEKQFVWFKKVFWWSCAQSRMLSTMLMGRELIPFNPRPTNGQSALSQQSFYPQGLLCMVVFSALIILKARLDNVRSPWQGFSAVVLLLFNRKTAIWESRSSLRSNSGGIWILFFPHSSSLSNGMVYNGETATFQLIWPAHVPACFEVLKNVYPVGVSSLTATLNL